jgi:hypothetical protein
MFRYYRFELTNLDTFTIFEVLDFLSIALYFRETIPRGLHVEIHLHSLPEFRSKSQ